MVVALPPGWLMAAAAFTLLEHSLLWALSPWAASLQKGSKGNTRPWAVEGVTKITGTILNIIQIRARSSSIRPYSRTVCVPPVPRAC